MLEPYLKKIGPYLSYFGKVLRMLPSSEKGQDLSSVYAQNSPSQNKSCSPCSESKSVQFITSENGQLLPGTTMIIDFKAVLQCYSWLLKL